VRTKTRPATHLGSTAALRTARFKSEALGLFASAENIRLIPLIFQFAPTRDAGTIRSKMIPTKSPRTGSLLLTALVIAISRAALEIRVCLAARSPSEPGAMANPQPRKLTFETNKRRNQGKPARKRPDFTPVCSSPRLASFLGRRRARKHPPPCAKSNHLEHTK
jgi:hypothetical protein